MRQVFIMLFNIMQNQVLSLQEKVDLDTMIRDAESVKTGTGMAHRRSNTLVRNICAIDSNNKQPR